MAKLEDYIEMGVVIVPPAELARLRRLEAAALAFIEEVQQGQPPETDAWYALLLAAFEGPYDGRS